MQNASYCPFLLFTLHNEIWIMKGFLVLITINPCIIFSNYYATTILLYFSNNLHMYLYLIGRMVTLTRD